MKYVQVRTQSIIKSGLVGVRSMAQASDEAMAIILEKRRSGKRKPAKHKPFKPRFIVRKREENGPFNTVRV